MKFIQGNLIIAAVWADFTERISRQSLAVSGLARIDENEVKGMINFLRKVALLENPAGKIRKAAQSLAWHR